MGWVVFIFEFIRHYKLKGSKSYKVVLFLCAIYCPVQRGQTLEPDQRFRVRPLLKTAELITIFFFFQKLIIIFMFHAIYAI